MIVFDYAAIAALLLTLGSTFTTRYPGAQGPEQGM